MQKSAIEYNGGGVDRPWCRLRVVRHIGLQLVLRRSRVRGAVQVLTRRRSRGRG